MPTRFCKRYSAFLAAYSENALPAKAAARIEAHLASCAACRDDLQALRQVSGVLLAHKPGIPEPSADLWQRVHAEIAAPGARAARPAWRLPGFAAPVAGLAAAVALFCVVVRPWQDPPVVTGSLESAAVKSASSAPGAASVAANVTKAQTTPQVSRSVPEPVRSPAPKTNIAAAPLPKAAAAMAAAAPAVQGADPFLSFEARNDTTRTEPRRVVKPMRRAPVLTAIAPRREWEPAKAGALPPARYARPRPSAPPVAPPRMVASAKGSGAGEGLPGETPSGEDYSAVSPPAVAYFGVGGGSEAGTSHGRQSSENTGVADADAANGFADRAAAAFPTTLTGAREVPASASAVTRYLSDKRKNSLFRYQQR